MPRVYICHWCGQRGQKAKAEVVVSAYTDQAYCVDEKSCKARMRLNARRAKKALEAKEAQA